MWGGRELGVKNSGRHPLPPTSPPATRTSSPPPCPSVLSVVNQHSRMLPDPDKLADAELRRLNRVKRSDAPAADPLGPAMIEFFKHSVKKRQTKLAKVAECWGRLVPEMLSEHASLESFHGGTLTVLVDSASHLYELKQLLLAGLQDQLLIACKSAGLRKVSLKRGRWYDGDDPGERKLNFGK